jgi:uncharacterized membrane protein YsdA (DUF1294 family)
LAAHLLWSLALAIALSAILVFRFKLAAWLSWLIAINVATAIAYTYDKTAACRTPQWRRVPERALHMLAILGGTPAAFASQQVLRHKTIKPSFRVWFWAITVLQAAMIAAWIWWRK